MKYPINEMLYLAISDGANIRIELIYTPRTLGRNGIKGACSANHVPPYIWCHFIGVLRFCQLGSCTDKHPTSEIILELNKEVTVMSKVALPLIP